MSSLAVLHLMSAHVISCSRMSFALQDLKNDLDHVVASQNIEWRPLRALGQTFFALGFAHNLLRNPRNPVVRRGRPPFLSVDAIKKDGGDETSESRCLADRISQRIPMIFISDRCLDTFPNNFAIRDNTAATPVMLAKDLGSSRRLVRRLRRVLQTLGVKDMLHISAFSNTSHENGSKLSQRRWRIQLNSSKFQSLALDAEIVLHVTKRTSLELSIESCRANGHNFRLWPEESIQSLQVDVPQILSREPSWRQFASDFTFVDGARVFNGLGPNKALLGLLRSFYRQSMLLPLQRKFRVATSYRFFVDSDGSFKPSFVAKWKFVARPDPAVPFLGSLKNVFPAVEGSATFLFNSAGKVRSLLLDQNLDRIVNQALFEIPYFAYGSNLNADVLARRTGGRSVVKTSPQPGFLQNYSLIFNLGQAPFGAAASVEPLQGQVCHGLVYTLDLQQFLAMLASEGVPFAYSVEEVDVMSYRQDGTVRRKAYTLRSGRGINSLPPSKRYKNLLVKGARENGLDESWIRWLESLDTSLF